MKDTSTIFMLVLIAIVGVFTLDVYLPGMPSMASQFGVTLTDITYTFTAFSVVFAFSQLIHGALSDYLGRKPVIIAGLAIAGVATLMCIQAKTYEFLFASRIVQALGISAFVVVNAIIRDLYTGAKAVQVRTVVATVSGISISIAPTIGALLQARYNWQGGFIASLILIAITLSYAVLFYSESNINRDKSSFNVMALLRTYTGLFANKNYQLHILIVMLAYTVHFSFIIMSASIFVDMLGATPLLFGYLMFAYGGVYFLGGLLTTWIAIKLQVGALIRLGGCLIIAGGLLMFVLLLIPDKESWQILLPMAVITFGVTMSRAAATTGALAPMPAQSGQGAGGLNLVQFAVSALIATGISKFGSDPQVAIGLLAITCGYLINCLIKRVKK